MTTREPGQRASPAGNERLTAMTGAVLLVLFAAECLTQPTEQARTVLAARPTRWLLLCGSVALGLVLAFATYHLSGNWGGSGSLIP